MNTNKNQQLSFDLGRDNVKTIDEIAASFNAHCAKTLGDIENWPGNIFCLYGADHSGIKTLAQQWVRANNIEMKDQLNKADIAQGCNAYALLYSTNISEDLLFALFQRCENEGTKLLLVSSTAPRDWAIDLPDLRSRTNSLPILEVRPISEDHFSQILISALNQLAIKLKKADIISIYPREIYSFSLIAQIFGHICVLVNNGELLNSARVKVILRDLAHSAINKDLFDDDNKYKNNLP